MAARARVEFVTMGIGQNADGVHTNIIRSRLQSDALLAVSTSATSAGSRPTAPAASASPGRQIYARVTCLDNPIYVAWGADPTATATNSLMLTANGVEMIPVASGDKLSFLEVT